MTGGFSWGNWDTGWAYQPKHTCVCTVATRATTYESGDAQPVVRYATIVLVLSSRPVKIATAIYEEARHALGRLGLPDGPRLLSIAIRSRPAPQSRTRHCSSPLSAAGCCECAHRRDTKRSSQFRRFACMPQLHRKYTPAHFRTVEYKKLAQMICCTGSALILQISGGKQTVVECDGLSQYLRSVLPDSSSGDRGSNSSCKRGCSCR